MKLFLLFLLLWGASLFGSVHMWMEVAFPPVVLSYTRNVHWKKKKLNKNNMYISWQQEMMS